MYKKILLSLIICLLIILFRDNICFFIGNVFGVFKIDNNYYDAIIDIKDDKINYLENEIKESDTFLSNIRLINYNYLVSKVIYKESYSMGNFIIQYGSNNNVSDGLGVINEYGVVGKITKVDKKVSELTLLRDIKDLSVKINDTYGKLNYNYDKDEFVISDISNYDKVYVNDKVYTSGYGSIKESLYIGKVKKIENEDISKKIIVDTDVDFNNINYVLIVGDF